ncbi:MAG: hypothetical protein RL299_56 [Pseudomonadota bacterium]
MPKYLVLPGAAALTLIALPVAANPAAKTTLSPKTGAATSVIKPSVVVQPQTDVPPLPDQGCPTPPQGGEAAADWRPPPIPPKVAQGGEAAADWRPPPIPPKDAPGTVVQGGAVQGGKAAADWRPPPIPPREARPAGCAPQASESADWRPPPIPPKR